MSDAATDATTEATPAAKVPLGRNYRTLFAASTLSNLGDGVAAIA